MSLNKDWDTNFEGIVFAERKDRLCGAIWPILYSADREWIMFGPPAHPSNVFRVEDVKDMDHFNFYHGRLGYVYIKNQMKVEISEK